MAWWSRKSPRFPSSSVRTFGDFNRTYFRSLEASDFADPLPPPGRLFSDFKFAYEPYAGRADRRFFRREFEDLLDQRFNSSLPRRDFEIQSPARSLSSLAAAEAMLNGQPSSVQAPPVDLGRLPDLSDGYTRGDNRVAANLKLAAKASAADGRVFHPDGPDRHPVTIYGTKADRTHSPLVVVAELRRRKRREVLFARRRIGRR